MKKPPTTNYYLLATGLIQRIKLRTWIALGLILVLLPLAIYTLYSPRVSSASWSDEAFSRRQPFSFTHNAAIASPRSVTVSVDTAEFIAAGVMQADCDDTRFTDKNGNFLEYDLTGTCDNAATTYEVYFNEIINGTNQAYIYYGSSAANNQESVSTSWTQLTPSGGDPSITTRTSEEKGPAPAAYWKFDEAVDNTCSGGTNDTCDLSGNANDGAKTGASWLADDLCKFGNCLYFDGTDDTVTVSNTVAGVQTVSFWIKIFSNSTTEQILDLNGTDYFTSVNGTLTVNGFGTDTIYVDGVSGATTLSPSRWHHVVVTTTTGFSASGIAFTEIASSYGNVVLDEVKLYDYEKTASEVNAEFAARGSDAVSVVFGFENKDFLNDGLLGYWELNESSGNATDSSGNGYTLTNNGTTTYVNAKFANGSEHVPASVQYLSTASTLNNVQTVSFWVNPDSNTNYYLSLTASDYITSSTGTISVTGFGTNEKIYVNGVESTTIAANTWQLVTVVADTGINANTFYVGRQSGNYFDGTMDEVRAYNRALSSAEIQNLYAWAPGPDGYWPMDESTGTSTTFDRSGNGNNGTLNSITQNSWMPGQYGSGLKLNGSSSYVSVTDAISISPTKTTSFGGWFYPVQEGSFVDNYKNMLVFDDNSSQAKYRLHTDSGGFETEGTVTTDTGTLNQIRLATKPTGSEDERILCTVNAQKLVKCQVWNGSSWGSQTTMATNNGSSEYPNVDVVYESTSGDALACFRDSDIDSSIPYCDVWNGSSWTGADANDVTDIITSIRLYPDPASDNIMMLIEAVGVVSAQLWNGSSWGSITTLETSAGTSYSTENIAGVWNSNEDFFAFWFDDGNDDIEARIYDKSTGWEASPSVAIANSSTADDVWIKAAAHPTNGKVVVVQSDDDDTADGNYWDSGWGTETQLEDDYGNGVQTHLNKIIALAWERGDGSDAIVAYGESSTALKYRVFSNATNTFGSEQSLPNSSGDVYIMYMNADPYSTNIMLTYNSSSTYVESLEWDGSAWDTSWTTHESTSTTAYPVNFFNYDYENENSIVGGTTDIVLASKNNSYRLFWDSNGYPNCQFHNGTAWQTAVASTNAASLDAWHHYMCTYDGATVRLYEKGLETANASASYSIADNANALNIGYDASSTYTRFAGVVDDFRLYKYARTSSQVVQDYNAGHPIGGSPISSQTIYWKFDELTGTTANDRAGNENGTISGASWLSENNCKSHGCLSFDAAAEAVTITNANDADVDFNTSEAFSGSAWIYVTTMPGTSDKDAIIAKWDETSTLRGYRFYISDADGDSSANLSAEIYDESANQAITVSTTTEPISVNTWYHVGFTFNGGQAGNAGDLAVYIDGTKHAQNSANASFLGLEDVAVDFTVGEYDATDAVAGNTNFVGRIDEVKIYNDELTEAQMKVDANFGSAINFGTGTLKEDQTLGGTGNPPIGWWKLDENKGTSSTYDSSGNGNTGTINGSMVEDDWEPGVYGSALHFDGSNDFVNVYSSQLATDFDLTSGSLTAWFKVDEAAWSDNADRRVTAFGASETDTVTIIKTNGNLLSSVHERSGGSANCATGDLDWIFMGISWDSTSGDVIHYCNGRQTDIDPYVTSSGTLQSDRAAIGAYQTTPSQVWDGVVDDVRLYDYERTQAQIAYDFNGGLPYIHFKFDEGSGTTTVYDSSWNNLTGSMNGTMTSGDWVTGKYNTALDFDGSDDRIVVTDSDDVRFIDGADFTLSGWIYTGLASSDAIFGKKNGNLVSNTGYLIEVSTNGEIIFYASDGTDQYTLTSPTGAVSANTWTHVAVVFDDDSTTNTDIYINGKKQSATPTGTLANVNALTSTGQNFTIGAEADNQNHFTGRLDDIRVYRYAMSEAEITKVMNNASMARFGPLEGSP